MFLKHHNERIVMDKKNLGVNKCSCNIYHVTMTSSIINIEVFETSKISNWKLSQLSEFRILPEICSSFTEAYTVFSPKQNEFVYIVGACR